MVCACPVANRLPHNLLLVACLMSAPLTYSLLVVLLPDLALFKGTLSLVALFPCLGKGAVVAGLLMIALPRCRLCLCGCCWAFTTLAPQPVAARLLQIGCL